MFISSFRFDHMCRKSLDLQTWGRNGFVVSTFASHLQSWRFSLFFGGFSGFPFRVSILHSEVHGFSNGQKESIILHKLTFRKKYIEGCQVPETKVWQSKWIFKKQMAVM